MRARRKPFLLTLAGLFTAVVFVIICLFQLELEAFLAYRKTSYKNAMLNMINYVDPHEDNKGHTHWNKDNAADQKIVDYIAENLKCHYEVLDNIEDGPNIYTSKISFTNVGRKTITNGQWAIYFSHLHMIDLESLEKTNDSGLRISHINGYLFTTVPKDTFRGFEPDKTLEIKITVEGSSVANTDVFPNWYVSAPRSTPRVIKSTAGEDLAFVGAFDNSSKWKRFRWDRYDPYTARTRFDLNDDIIDMQGAPLDVVPTPRQIFVKRDKTMTLNNQWKLVADYTLINEARYLSKKMGLPIVNKNPTDKYIKLGIGKVYIDNVMALSEEAYNMNIDVGRQIAYITGVGGAGVFYGIQSLLSLYANGALPEALITDEPRFRHRGVHLDVCRNFLDKNYVMKLMDAMAVYKLNKFHFHLSEDEGWRIQIPGIEELTKIGGHRCHDLTGEICLTPQLGFGPTGNDSGSGFYTVSDYREILRYAQARHIQVIPEIDIPGHSQASVISMKDRYKRYARMGDMEAAERYLLTDLNDTLRYMSPQKFNEDAINPCINSTYRFIDHVISELVRMHADIQPLGVFHFGGDEVSDQAWYLSPACDNLKEKHEQIKTNKDLKEYFTHRIAEITNSKGLDLGVWEDGVVGEGGVHFNRTDIVNKRVITYAWNNIWETGMSNNAYRMANEGYEVVLSLATHLYFDHPQEPDPAERGHYWSARKTETRKVFNFNAYNVYANADVTSAGDPMTEETLCYIYTDCYKLRRPENVIGMQVQLWTELVRTPEQADFMMFPRLLAAAERAWHKAEWETSQVLEGRDRLRTRDWQMFANTLGHKELAKLEAINIEYRLPPPGGRFQDGYLRANVEIPGLPIEYSKDGGATWHDFKERSTMQNSLNQDVLLRTRSTDGKRHSRVVTVPLAEDT